MDATNLLIAEDSDIEHVVYNLCKRYQLPEQFKVKNKGSVSTVLKELTIELKSPTLKRLGVVIDADADLPQRWQSVVDRLQKFGYRHVPVIPEISGTIIVELGRPKLGIWLMPNNQLAGMVEHFAAFLIPQGDSLWPMAQRVVLEIPDDSRRFNHPIKAQVHTWLAWQEDPGRPIGTAITNRYLDANAPHAQQFVNWLKRLFELEATPSP